MSFDLNRFLVAQDEVYGDVKAELGAGLKTTHWMWFVFPQAAGLGRSDLARHYGIGSLAEAAAYAEHPVLGARLRECCRLLLATPGRSAGQIFGHTDEQKLRSCMTLFQAVAPDGHVFGEVLGRFYDGRLDAATEEIVDGWRSQP